MTERSPQRTGERVLVPDLARPWQSSEVSQLVIEAIKKGHQEVEVDLRSCQRAYPNTVAPLRSDLDLFEDRGLRVEVLLPPKAVGVLGAVRDTPDADPGKMYADHMYLDGAFRFRDSRQVTDITTRTVAALSRSQVCSHGVLLAIELSLNEIADNVIQHAHTDAGVVSILLQRERRYLAICVADSGIGILGSFRASGHDLPNDTAAIRKAVMEGVTRDPNIGAGNGLWILHELVRANSGALGIKSGAATMLLTDMRESFPAGQRCLDDVHRGTSVDFQLALDREIDVKTALGGYEPVNLRLEAFEDATGNVRVTLSALEMGVGTRKAGAAARHLIANLLEETQDSVTVDCAGARPSFSFFDECFAKLAEELGWDDFDSYVRVVGLSEVEYGFLARTMEKRRARSRG